MRFLLMHGRDCDSYEIVWETCQNAPVQHPTSSFTGPVLQDCNESIADQHIVGDDVTLLGEIESNGLQVLQVTGPGPLHIVPAAPGQTEIWILEGGSVHVGRRELHPLTVIQLKAGAGGGGRYVGGHLAPVDDLQEQLRRVNVDGHQVALDRRVERRVLTDVLIDRRQHMQADRGELVKDKREERS